MIYSHAGDASALAIGAAPDLVREGVRIRLHAFSASNARNELANAARRLGGAGGGLMVPCVGRGPALYGAEGVESEALGPSLELAGFFANGEIGPVGGRTFVHTFSTSVGLLRRRAAAS
jgi:small ligand-binding sensory domain FIST